MTTPDEFVSITEAARRLEIRRATIDRWIAEGKLSATRSETDRRVLLIRFSQAEALLKKTTRIQSVSRTPLNDDQPEETYFPQIDSALQLVYSHSHRLAFQLFPAAFRPLTIEQLRAGPLGQDLLHLARIASGAEVRPRDSVLIMIESLIQLLVWPAGADDYLVPRSFWDTELGRMLALAKFRAFDASDLITIGDAAKRLGVTRPIIYRWMDDRTLNYVRDDATGRTFVVVRDVTNLLSLTREMTRED